MKNIFYLVIRIISSIKTPINHRTFQYLPTTLKPFIILFFCFFPIFMAFSIQPGNYPHRNPVFMLKHPNNMASLFEDSSVSNRTTDELMVYLKMTEAARLSSHYSSLTAIENSSFYPLYQALSLPYYQGTSFQNFLSHIIFGNPVQVIDRPLMKGIITLCKRHSGMALGKMLDMVKNQKDADPNVTAFLTYYKDYDYRKYIRIFEQEDITDNPAKASQQSLPAQVVGKIAKNSKRLISNGISRGKNLLEMSLVFIGLLPGIQADSNNKFTCDDGQKIPNNQSCLGLSEACDYTGNATVENCCIPNSINTDISQPPTTTSFPRRTIENIPNVCRSKKTDDLLFKCTNGQVIPKYNVCNGYSSYQQSDTDCDDKSDEATTLCCADNLINTTENSCTKRRFDNYHLEPQTFSKDFYMCHDGYVMKFYDSFCALGEMNCDDKNPNIDLAEICCKGGRDGLNADRFCEVKYKSSRKQKIFVCRNGRIINHLGVCNFRDDCDDGSDETAQLCCKDGILSMDSNSRICNPQYHSRVGKFFVCLNNQTISFSKTCDGINDCSDNSDETTGKNAPCFRCSNNSTIKMTTFCNHHKPFNPCGGDWPKDRPEFCCVHGREGINITTQTCQKREKPSLQLFVCNNNQLINNEREACHFNLHSIYDGCTDHSDKQVHSCCLNGEEGFDNTTQSCQSLRSPSQRIFLCPNRKKVIPNSSTCNTDNDCADWSDEHPDICCKPPRICCQAGNCPDTTQKIRFDCNDNLTIPSYQRCNGVNNCKDGSDEWVGRENATCFKCKADSTLIFIERTCNSAWNCPDGSDEALCNKDEGLSTMNITIIISVSAAAIAGILCFLFRYFDKKDDQNPHFSEVPLEDLNMENHTSSANVSD
ncbi:hypothetical protein CI610_00255 [invertebrate metagenome]|uniref:Uncharacterized protein n=1 Tax=invertebrate metagenome TaxID=1711999 RepID=A0A2H9TC46_9ZZZZ